METKNIIVDGDSVEIKNDTKTEAGKCPNCGKELLQYDPFEFCDNAGFYGYVCGNCEFEGKEWYDLKYSGHQAEGGQDIV